MDKNTAQTELIDRVASRTIGECGCVIHLNTGVRLCGNVHSVEQDHIILVRSNFWQLVRKDAIVTFSPNKDVLFLFTEDGEKPADNLPPTNKPTTADTYTADAVPQFLRKGRR